MAQGGRVDSELVRRGLARSREHAATLVTSGRVRAGGRRVRKPAQRISAASELLVEADSDDPGYASRAGHKLAGALQAFGRSGPAVRGCRCLDVGSSTGGFTDVLLRGGAEQVICLDVGREQLLPRLREDPRTVVLEGRNVRDVTPDDLGGPVDLVVTDVSFISLVLVLPVLADLTAPGGDMVVLVKPQFEVGRDRLGSGGVVRDRALRREAVRRVVEAAQSLGWGLQAVVRSPLPGPSGNVEYFLWLRRGPGTLGAEAIEQAIGQAVDQQTGDAGDQAVSGREHGEKVSG